MGQGGSCNHNTRDSFARVFLGVATANYDLYVYDGAGRQLGGSLNRAGVADTLALSYIGIGTAVIYLRVRYVSGGTGTSTAGMRCH